MNNFPAPPSELCDGQKATRATRRTVMALALLLSSALFLAMLMVVGIAWRQNQSSMEQESQLLRGALQARHQAITTDLRDYAFWHEAWEHLHLSVDRRWAWDLQNLAGELFTERGYDGVFVVDAADVTRYAVVDGRLSDITFQQWLGGQSPSLLNRARQSGRQVVSENVWIDNTPALVAVAPIMPGKAAAGGADVSPSVMVFVYRLTPGKLRALGEAIGVSNVRIPRDRQDRFTAPRISEQVSNGPALVLRWDADQPGQDLLFFLLPLLGFGALILAVVTRRVIGRAMDNAMLSDARFLQLMHSQRELAASEGRFRDVAEAASDWIWETDAEGRISYLSKRFSVVTGFGMTTSLGRHLDEILQHDAYPVSRWIAEQRAGGQRSQLRCYLQSLRNGRRICCLVARPVMLQGKLLGYRGTVSDITHEVEAEARIHYLSQHDVLTGLPNRLYLQEFLQARLQTQSKLALISLDLDHFKPVNDTFGHAAGDRVLKEVAQRLRNCLSAGDLVARLGGDEFILVGGALTTTKAIEACCHRLLSEMRRPFTLGAQEVYIGASLGIAMAPGDAQTAEQLLQLADIALYQSKQQGRNRWVFYTGAMSRHLAQRSEMEHNLRKAIAAQELRLYYQPRYRLQSGRLEGAEALIRWQTASAGLLLPPAFIPLAEETGLIVEISDWVLDRACRDAAGWPSHLTVSVNISPVEFRSGNLARRVAAALRNSGLEAHRLELEITENITVENPDNALDTMQQLKQLGVKISVDDFGAGLASLNYLKTFPLDGMKMDQSYLNDYPQSPQAQSIVAGIIGLGKAFSLTVKAEGIETQAQLEQLKSISCQEGQGFLLGRPMPLGEFTTLLHMPLAYSLNAEGTAVVTR